MPRFRLPNLPPLAHVIISLSTFLLSLLTCGPQLPSSILPSVLLLSTLLTQCIFLSTRTLLFTAFAPLALGTTTAYSSSFLAAPGSFGAGGVLTMAVLSALLASVWMVPVLLATRLELRAGYEHEHEHEQGEGQAGREEDQGMRRGMRIRGRTRKPRSEVLRTMIGLLLWTGMQALMDWKGRVMQLPSWTEANLGLNSNSHPLDFLRPLLGPLGPSFIIALFARAVADVVLGLTERNNAVTDKPGVPVITSVRTTSPAMGTPYRDEEGDGAVVEERVEHVEHVDQTALLPVHRIKASSAESGEDADSCSSHGSAAALPLPMPTSCHPKGAVRSALAVLLVLWLLPSTWLLEALLPSISPSALVSVGCVLPASSSSEAQTLFRSVHLSNQTGHKSPATKEDKEAQLLHETRVLAGRGAKVLVWPEGALVVQGERQEASLWRKVGEIAAQTRTNVVIAYILQVGANSRTGSCRLNRAALVMPESVSIPEGHGQQKNETTKPAWVYDKRHLVPFVESFGTRAGTHEPPIADLLIPVVSSSLHASARQHETLARVSVGPQICYDVEFADTPSAPTLLVSPAHVWEHSMAVHGFGALRNRVLEQGMGAALRCDNGPGGASGLIDSRGVERFVQTADQGYSFVTTAALPLRSVSKSDQRADDGHFETVPAGKTVYARLHNSGAWGLLFGFTLIGWAMELWGRKVLYSLCARASHLAQVEAMAEEYEDEFLAGVSPPTEEEEEEEGPGEENGRSGGRLEAAGGQDAESSSRVRSRTV